MNDRSTQHNGSQGTKDPGRPPTDGEGMEGATTERRPSGAGSTGQAAVGASAEPGDRTGAAGDPRHDGNGTGRSPASVTTLLRDLADDAAVLTRKEVALARSEIEQAISGLKTGLVSTATGGGVLFTGILFLLLSATFGLAIVVDFWLAALIVGGIVTLIGLIMVMAGKRKLQAEQFRPDRTVDAMHKDREMLQRRRS